MHQTRFCKLKKKENIMEVRQYNVFTFDELQEDIQEKALDNLRDINVDYEWWECTMGYYVDLLARVGFEGADISFSGFYCQGDGSSFVANCDAQKILDSMFFENEGQIAWLIKKGLTDKATAELKRWTLWFAMAENHGGIRFSIRRNASRYSHEFTVSPDVEIDGSYTDNGTWTNGVWESVFMSKVGLGVLQSMFEEYARDWCRKVYKGLEDEYEYLTSDEAITETILANGYSFTEDGELD